jgi:hypothetical protein
MKDEEERGWIMMIRYTVLSFVWKDWPESQSALSVSRSRFEPAPPEYKSEAWANLLGECLTLQALENKLEGYS